ncbi:MAG: hypothetical protein II741_02305 [Lachnospiraceae bacterium]|nr:hypothetical protein [Lachnospiraceae bacterium]
MTTPFKRPFSPTVKLIFFSVLLGLSLIAYVIVNNKIENGQMAEPVADFVDLSTCDYSELGDDKISLTVPGEYAAGATDDSLSETASDLGYESITLNDNGSVTYVMTKAQHKEMLDNLRSGINQTFDKMIGSADYNKITSIEANDDFTYIKVNLSSKNADYKNSMSMIQFKTYFLLYNAFNGTPDAKLSVEYFNKDGELVLKMGSDDL